MSTIFGVPDERAASRLMATRPVGCGHVTATGRGDVTEQEAITVALTVIVPVAVFAAGTTGMRRSAPAKNADDDHLGKLTTVDPLEC
jgi:hypothetical protein